MEKSIYLKICDHLQDGKLDNSFSLSQDYEGVPFAPGAQDGIYLYHMQSGGLDTEGAREMEIAVKEASKNNYPKTDALFFEWTKQHRAINHAASLQQYIDDHEQSLNINKIFKTGLSLMLHSSHIECVKIGLVILELFFYDNSVQEIVRRIGTYDEFTLFSVWNMQHWDNGNEEIFSLAKKVHGWGRIHAVEYLKPETEEIRHWLLMEGTQNNVMNAYSSLTCWKKSNAEEILFGNPSKEEYKAISELIEGMLDEGPVKGISGLNDPEKVILRLLAISSKYELLAADYKRISSIHIWAKENGYISILDACNELLHTPSCMECIQNTDRDTGEPA